MAKYTDPNTGVKYSTHTGLKVFTVIVVILLVISVVLNVVFYMQSSDVSVSDDGTDEELYGDGDESGDGDDDGYNDGDGGNLDGILPEDGDYDGDDGYGGDTDEDSSESESGEPGEGIVDTETIIENEYAKRTSDFDEHGAATCIYTGYDSDVDAYITKGGAVYDYSSQYLVHQPDVKTQVLYAEDGSTDINSEIRVSLVFDGVPKDEDDEYSIESFVEFTDYYYTTGPQNIEVVSLTGEPLEIESVDWRQYEYYVNTSSGFSAKYTKHVSAGGYEVEIFERNSFKSPDVTTVYGKDRMSYDGEYTFTLTLKDGSIYSFEYWYITRPDKMLDPDIEVVYEE